MCMNFGQIDKPVYCVLYSSEISKKKFNPLKNISQIRLKEIMFKRK